jgi:hypothetical protein
MAQQSWVVGGLFQPTIPGWYLMTVNYTLGETGSTQVVVYLTQNNGVGNLNPFPGFNTSGSGIGQSFQVLQYLNGTTDAVQLNAYTYGGTSTIVNGYFSAILQAMGAGPIGPTGATGPVSSSISGQFTVNAINGSINTQPSVVASNGNYYSSLLQYGDYNGANALASLRIGNGTTGPLVLSTTATGARYGNLFSANGGINTASSLLLTGQPLELNGPLVVSGASRGQFTAYGAAGFTPDTFGNPSIGLTLSNANVTRTSMILFSYYGGVPPTSAPTLLNVQNGSFVVLSSGYANSSGCVFNYIILN